MKAIFNSTSSVLDVLFLGETLMANRTYHAVGFLSLEKRATVADISIVVGDIYTNNTASSSTA